MFILYAVALHRWDFLVEQTKQMHENNILRNKKHEPIRFDRIMSIFNIIFPYDIETPKGAYGENIKLF